MRVHRGRDSFTAEYQGETATADRADEAVAEVVRRASRNWNVRRIGGLNIEIFSGERHGWKRYKKH